jgi:GAF domain-containing protein
MAEIPSRAELAEVWTSASTIAAAPAFGVARRRDHDRLSVLYCYEHGFGEFVLPGRELPDGWLSDAGGDADVELPQLLAHQARAFEGFLLHNGVQRLVALPIGEPADGALMWVGLADAAAPVENVRTQLHGIAGPLQALLDRPMTPLQAVDRLRRLELAADLLPALLHVLDVRQVFERLSAAGRASLPHDQLLMFLFEEGLTSFRVFARTDRGDVDRVLPNPYPPDSIRVWGFSIIDDHLRHPLEKDAPATKLGGRSSIRLPITFDERVIGGIAFVSKQPALYTSEDIPIGRRLADHVATALSHHQLAEQLVEQARRAEELRARTTSLELLDELLSALTDSGELSDVFGRVTTIARKVLPHDAAALMVRLPDGKHARAYALSGIGAEIPETTEVPEELLANTDWDHHIFDDVSTESGEAYQRLTRAGLLSLLRVPIRLENQFAGALLFMARTRGAFKQTDILVARRTAVRMAATLAHDRELAALKKADEATVRAARLEARVQALTDELDARTGFRRVVGTSKPWRQVLTQATQVAAAETTVLLLGESGTGKEVIARFVHRASVRKGGPFIAINCAALPD